MSGPEMRGEFGFPPKIDDFFGEVASAADFGWDYRLWVEEWAESYLGAEPFASLADRFASTPGVAEVEHMDREVFLINSHLHAERLRESLWPHFVAAAHEGVSRDA